MRVLTPDAVDDAGTAAQRLGRNHGAYRGEAIDIAAVLEADLQAAQAHAWQPEWLTGAADLRLLTLRRPCPGARRRIYMSTGIHGDEPAGPLAVRQLLEDDAWPAGCDLWLCPCLNPTGFPLNRRENRDGTDLNRDYRQPTSAEVRAHTAWLDRQPSFDLSLCLHEDWEAHGFYVYELNPAGAPSLAETMIGAVARVCPIDLSPLIEGREAHGGIIRPVLDPTSRPDWPEAFHLIRHKTSLSYTLEAPSDFPLAVRVAALVMAVKAALAPLPRP
jgi:murein peptide amidase A